MNIMTDSYGDKKFHENRSLYLRFIKGKYKSSFKELEEEGKIVSTR